MSYRNLKKLYGKPDLPPLDGDSDEEFVPLYASKSTTSTYEGLEVTTSDSEHNEEQEPEEETEDPAPAAARVVVAKQRRKMSNKLKKAKQNNPQLDEIDQSVREVNAILGSPAPIGSTDAEAPPVTDKKLFKITAKFLCYKNERTYYDEESNNRRYKPHNVTKYRRAYIIDVPPSLQYLKPGFKMEILSRSSGVVYYSFEHNRDYQNMHKDYLKELKKDAVIDLDSALGNIHVEALVDCVDVLYGNEDQKAGLSVLEHIITYFQFASHASFNLTDPNARLSYNMVENRPFFVALLKYMHVLTNRAQHRTALEIAKMMLNFDPTDPLGLIYVIDILAIRAEEYKWLLDVIKIWNDKRQARYLFNLKYSSALAQYFIATRDKLGLAEADKALQEAILAFPMVTMHLIKEMKMEDDASRNIATHGLFTNVVFESRYPTSDHLRTAISVYTKLAYWRWNEPKVKKWLIRNAETVLGRFTTEPAVVERAAHFALLRLHLFNFCPTEIERHIYIIKPMSTLLLNCPMKGKRRFYAWDPMPPPTGVNRCGYGTRIADAHPSNVNYRNMLFDLFSSVMPAFIPEELRDPPRAAPPRAANDAAPDERQQPGAHRRMPGDDAAQ